MTQWTSSHEFVPLIPLDADRCVIVKEHATEAAAYANLAFRVRALVGKVKIPSNWSDERIVEEWNKASPDQSMQVERV